MSERSPQSLAAEIAAHESWARTPDRTARTAPGLAAALAKFEREADPDGVLPPEERTRRAEHLRRAHLARIALKSAKARRARAAAERALAEADAELAAATEEDDR